MKKQVLWAKRDSFRIYGEYYLPDNVSGKVPLVICSHGFRANHTFCDDDAQMMCQLGFAVYTFDFVGCYSGGQSDGDFLDMSVLTEAADLTAVVQQLKERPEVDTNRIYLFGQSQGGFVSSYVAAQEPLAIAGLILLYPALCLQDDAKERIRLYGDSIEARMSDGTEIGEVYNRDAISFDIFEEMKRFANPVLIVHGDADKRAPIVYSERAVEIFPNAKLVTIAGADHGFRNPDEEKQSQQAIKDFLESLEA